MEGKVGSALLRLHEGTGKTVSMQDEGSMKGWKGYVKAILRLCEFFFKYIKTL